MTRKLLALLAFAVFAGLISTQDAHAYQIKRVIRGTVDLSTNEAFSLDLDDPNGDANTADSLLMDDGQHVMLDPSKTVIFVSNLTATEDHRVADAMVVQDDEHTLTFARHTGTAGTIYEYQVVEFLSGVTVQAGITIFSDGTSPAAYSKTITIDTVDLTKSFPIISFKPYTANSNTADERYMVGAYFTANNKLKLERFESAANYRIDIYYQVVSFDDNTVVQSGALATTNATSNTQNITTVNTAKSYLLFTTKAGNIGGNERYGYYDGAFNTSSQLIFRRLTANTNVNTIYWFVVEHQDENYAQSGRNTFGASATMNVTVPNAVVLKRSMLSHSFSAASGVTTQGMVPSMTKGYLSSTTNMAFQKGSTTTGVPISWTVNEYPPVHVVYPNGGETLNIGTQYNIQWEFADDLKTGGACGGAVSGYHQMTIQAYINGAYRDIATNVCPSAVGNTASYAWTVPATLSSQNTIRNDVKIRVYSQTLGAPNARSFDTSDTNFNIKGTLNITAPVGGETWAVGDTGRNITWTNTGDFNGGGFTGTIAYSTAGSGGPWTNIITNQNLGTGSGGSYNWNPIPDIIGTNTYIRISLNSETSPVVTVTASPAAFSIKRSLTLVNPGMGTGESYTAQTPWDIRWNYTGQTGWGTVKVQISTDPAHNVWTDLVTGHAVGGAPSDSPPYSGKGHYTANIPVSAVGDTVKVRVVSESDGSVLATSANDFAVLAKIALDTPSSAGIVVRVDDPYLITWTLSGSGVSTVKLEYSINGGSSWVSPAITDSTNATNVDSSHGSYNWNIPNNVGTTVKVRVSDTSVPTINDESDNNFEIKGQITGLSPNGGEVFDYDGSVPITWDWHGSSGATVDVLFSSDGTTFPPGNIICNDVLATTESCDWDLGTTPTGTNYKVRVEQVGDASNVYVQSTSTFRIKGTLDITSPAGGNIRYIGDTENITWTKNPSGLGNVKLEYTPDNGTNWYTITASTSGTSFGWNPANPGTALPDSGVLIRASLAADSTVSTTMASPFKVRGKLTLNVPSASGITWGVGTQNDITWTSTPLSQGNVEIAYSVSGGSYTVINNTTDSSAQSYQWTIPDAISNDVVVRVRSLNTENESAVSDVSDNPFAIRGRFTLTSPNGSEVWKVGEDRDLIWRTFGTIPSVKLYYSPNSGGNWNLIASAVSNLCDYDGSQDCVFDWGTVGGVADSILTTNQIRVESNTDANTFDTSNADFTVLGRVTLDDPSVAGEILRVGGSKLIQFSKFGTMNTPTNNFKILYSTDSGTTYPDPANVIGTVTGSSVNWTNIPDAARSETARIKVQWEGNASGVNAESPIIKVKPNVTIIAPTSGTYNIGSALPIQFSHTGRTSDTFRFRYSINNGSTWTTIDTATNIDPNTTYTHATWNVPNDAGIVAGANQFKIRVELVGDETNVTADSNGVTILGNLGTVSLSSGGVGWTAADTTRQISWTRQGITTVKLEYTLNNGGDNYANTLSSSLTANSYTWSAGIPGSAVSDQVRFRVTAQDANDSVTEAISSMITIKPQLILIQPNGPTTRNVGASMPITWTSSGAGNIKVEYTTNADAGSPTWQTLSGYSSIDSTPQSDTNANVPDAVSSHVKFRLSNVNANPNLQVSSESNTEFTIQTALTLDAISGPFTLGDTINVTWTPSGSVGAVTVEYYNGSAWSTITTAAPQNGPYSLLLDSANGITNATNLARVRISATNGLATPSTSGQFTVRPYLVVTNPAGNESWVVDSSYNVGWTIKGSNISQVALYYSKDSGSTYPNLIIDPLNINFGGGNNMTYSWTIPNDIQATKNMKVRVATLPGSDPWAVSAVSNGLFQIVGELAMKVPDDTTPIAWRVGTSHDIEWTNVHGSVLDVKLEYSTNSGTNWSTLISSTPSGSPGDHAYTWNIPNNFTIVKDNFRIRVSDAANSAVMDASTAASSILADFAVVHPANGEVWVAENTHTIEWTTPVAGVPANVKIEYNVGGGWLDLPETDGTPNDGIVTNTGSVNWTLPVNRTSAAQVRISDPNNAASSVTSNNFKIRGDFTVTSPNSGIESWDIASTHAITFTKKGNVSNVKLQFSNNGGADWTALVDGNSADTQNIDVSGAGPYSFNWKIPDIAGQTTVQGRIRVVDASDATVYDSSDNNFTIKGSVVLNQPNGGETLGVGNVYSVSGVVNGVGITSVRLYYSTNGGGTYPNGLNEVGGGQVVAVSAGTFSQNWSVPNQIGSNLKVRVEDATNALVFDESNAAFSIKGTVDVTSPTSLSVWSAGSQQNIVWDRNGNVGNVDLYYQVNNGTWNTIATSVSSPNPTGNTYAWTLPTSGIVSTNVKVRVDGANLLTPDTTDSFTVKGSISLTYPDASGIALNLGDPLTVTWSQSGSIGNVKVEYYDGNSWTELTTTAPENGPYQFTLDTPITTVATALAKVRVSQANDATVVDTSANDFMVRPYLAVTSPAGNEAWVVGSSHNITWNRIGSNVANVRLLYSKDSGNNFNDVIQTSVTNNGSYAWTIPDDIQATKNMKVRVLSLPTTELYATSATSSGLFQIVGALTMTVPDDTTPVAWRVGSQDNEIKWDATGSIAQVRIEYSSNSGGAWNTIVADAPSGAGANKSYSWDIPNNQAIAKDTYRFRVSDSANSNVSDTAGASSSILANFGVTAPVTGNVWVAETANDITWTTPVPGTPTNVKLEYDLGGGYQTIQANASNSGTYSWTLPSGLSTAARVRISDPNDAASAIVSDPFKIRGSLTLTAPASGASWTYNTLQDITWTKLGDIATVKLEYTTNGTDYTLIATGVDASDLEYEWTVPDVMSNTVQVKVTDASDATVSSQSAAFTIKGTLTLTAPNGSENWVVGTVENITWNRTGSIANVNLHYSTNGGGTYPNSIASGVAANAPYPWTIPDAIGSQLRVRVTDAANATVLDASDANFGVKGALTLTSPNGGEILSVGASQNITWTRTGSIANIKIEYSTDSGATYPNSIVTITDATTGTYPWTVPDALGFNTRVRITDTTDATVLDASNGNFTIKGALTLTAPNGGEVWRVGQTQDIVWQRFGSIQFVKLELSTNGGSTYPTEIIASTGAAAGTYAWTIPDSIGVQAKVRVTDVNDSSVFDVSDANFSIKGTLVVTSPNGGEAWGVGTNQNITWTRTGSIANVRIEYSTDGGATYPTEIIDSTDASTGSYSWTIPDDLSITARVKVTNVSDGTVFDATNANFKIIGALTITAPNTNVGWKVGTNQNITWIRTGSIQDVKLEYSTDGGSTFPNQIIASTPAGGLSYNWAIPDDLTTTARVRISDATDATVNDVSDVNFKIQAVFTVTSPNGTEVWDVASSHDITWNKVGSAANVRLDYSTDSGANYNGVIHAGTGNTGTFSWTIPDAISAAVRVRVADVNDITANDASDANFTIRGVLTLTSPNGTENWDVASVHAVTWTRTGSIANVKLEYSTNGGSTYPGSIATSVPGGDLTYNWTLPDIISTNLKVRVQDTSDPTVFDVSDTVFTIKGALQVTSPNGAESWIVATGHNITWTRFGSIPSVKIELSVDGGGTYPTEIINSTDASTGTYAWTVPDNITTTARVKITDTSNANVFDASNANFVIRGSFTLTSPNGGQIWIVGSSQNITWTRSGSILNAKLEYSTDGGATFPNTIVGVTDAADGTEPWTVPDAIGTQVRVRVSDSSNATVFDDSNADFIIKGSLTLTAPNGGEVWVVGASQNITWTRSGTINLVKLEYSTNGGSTFPNTIHAGTNGLSGTYSWTIPDAIGTSLRVRVTDASDSTVFDDSDANFAVRGSLTLTAPNGGEAWVVASSRNITWTKTGTMTNVLLEYSTDSGATFPNVIQSSTDAAAGSYSWTIPDNIQSAVRVKVTSTQDANVSDTSDTNFKITGSVTLTAPNGGELWKVATNQNITWTRVGSFTNVRLDYSTNGGSTYPTTINPGTLASTLSFTWSVPDDLSTAARVRISDATDITVQDTSDANFQIIAGLTVTSPNGGEVWTVGSAQDITWNRTGSASSVKIEYSTNGGSTYPNEITSGASNTGSYSWTVPDSISASVKVRVSDAANANANDVSDGNFKIRGSLTLTAPNGNEVWTVASSQNITWTKVGSITTVKLEYSTDSGSTYPNLINGSVDGSLLTHAWTVPDDISPNVRVKITDANDSTVYDESNTNFRIAGSITVTSPNGSEVWNVASAHNITWTKVGSIATVKIEYSTDGGGSYPNVIVPSVQASDLSFPWTIPDDITTQARVKITDTAFSGATDTSNANFKIAGVLTITSPNGSEVWDVASVHAITWTKQGTIASARLEYSTDGGATYPNVIQSSVTASNLSYNWTVPDSISNQVRVKITNLGDSQVFDESNANFKIAGVLGLTSPNGGEVWSVNTSQAISWTRVGSIAQVKLEYSVNGGVDYPNLIQTNVNASTLSYSWSVPDVISATMKVRISDVSDASVFDVSDANFKIRGSFTLTAPNGTEGWVIGSSRNITWTKQGTIADAKLDYSKDGGATYPFNIVGSVPAADLTYSWTVPDDAGTQIRVRISQVGDATIFDASDANFTIRAGFTVTSPTGGEIWAVGSSHDITWVTGGTIPNVKLEYSANGGNSYTTIIGTTTNNQTYAWVVPDAITTQARVRVSDVNDPVASDFSAGNFKIHGTFTLTAPNGGEAWLVGTSQNITWTKTGSISGAKLEYSTNGGSTYPNLIIGSTSASALSYSWTIPDAIGATLRVRITDTADATVWDVSNNDFRIKGNFTMTSPNGNEVWAVGSSQNITWGTLGTVGFVKLEYATDGGTAYNSIVGSVANTGSYNWTIPDAITTQARVRVSDVNDSTASDASDGNFKIRGNLVVTAPNGGEKWNVGTNRLITWDRTGSIPTVRIEYSSNNGTIYIPIDNNASNTGAYSWTIPDSITTQALVRITDLNDNTVTDVSNANFKIMGNFTVTSPNGGEVWTVSSAQNITWTSSGTMTFAKLEYSTDAGATFPNLIDGSTSNNGLYAWTVPDAISGQVRVRVSDPNDSDAFDISNANFRVRMVFALTSPNGGQKWAVGSTQNITWNFQGTIPAVKIQYSRDTFLTDINTIHNGAPATGTFAWTVPDAISSSVRVRVSDPNDIGALDDSNADFKILGGFTVTSPNGGERWDVNSLQTITWNRTGTVPDARIEYSTDGGATYPYTIAADTNDGSYDWLVPDTITAAFRVRVSDLADAEAFDTSNANAKIRAKFTVLTPNGGEIWTVSESNAITWSTVGTVANVRLDYSTDSGTTFPNIITSGIANSGTFNWTVPDAISTNVRVRVMSVTDSDAFDASDANFKVRGKFAVTSPNGGELWRIAQANNITWNTTGTISNVALYYSTNSGVSFPNTIQANIANTGAYSWTLPDSPSPNARVRVENVADTTVFDDSNANFSIQGFFTLTAPNGGEQWAVATSQNITWSWGGTIPNVRLTYSTDSGATYPHTIQALAANGAGGSGNHSYSWTIPDNISNTVRVKVEDPADPTVFDDSNANFKISGAFALTAPGAGDRWVTNEVRAITWNTSGTIPNVKLEYSHNNFTSSTVIAANILNTGTYNWTIPDPGIANVPLSTRVRVSDVNDATTLSNSPAFNIDYYLITWEIRDLVTNASLSQLTVNEVKASDPNFIQWSEAGISTNPPRVQPTPYGTWVATWSKAGFGDGVQVVVANQDQSILLYMETSTVHIWLADSRVSYDPDADTLSVAGWLSRDGSITTGAINAVFKIYDGATLLYTLTDNTVDPAGFFSWSVAAPTGFVAGRTYTTICEVTVGSGGVFKTPSSFQITDAKKLEEVKDTVNAVLDVPISVVQANLQTTLDQQTQTIQTELANQTQLIQTTLTNFENTISSSIVALESAAQSSLESAETLEATALKFSWKAVVAPNPALTGTTIILEAQGPTGLFPIVSVYNHKNKQVVINALMTESGDRPGNYSFSFDASQGNFEPGQAYTYIVTEDITGGLVAGSGFVESLSLTSVAGLAAAAPAAEKAAKQAVDAIRALEAQMAKGGDIQDTMKLLKRAVEDLKYATASASGTVAEEKAMRERISEMTEKLRLLAGDQGLDFDELFRKAIDESSTIQDIRNRTGSMSQVVELIGAVVEKRLGGVEEPIVDIQLEPAV